MKPHKHANLIKAWAEGALIQINTPHGWQDIHSRDPAWCSNSEYRLSPLRDRYLRFFITVHGTIDFVVREEPDATFTPHAFKSWAGDWVTVVFNTQTIDYSVAEQE